MSLRVSTSSSSSPEPSSSAPFLCQVCDNDAQGSHFGAQTCRACAAFFRRTIVLDLKYSCRFGTDCEISKDKLFNCRCCRFKKCVSVGMIPDNVQWNRDASSSTVKRKRKHSDDGEELVIPDKRLLPGWRRSEKGPPIFDLTNLFRRIKRAFSKFKEPTDSFYLQSNTLTRMDWALRNFRELKSGEIQVRSEFSFEEIIGDKGGLIKMAAEWMMHSEEFRSLCPAEKFQVFMETWQLWDRLCKIKHSCEVFGKRVLEEKLHMMGPNEACNMDRVHVDFSSISNRPSFEIKKMLRPLIDQMFDEVVKPLLDIQPTSMETTYLLCNITSNITCKSFPETVSTASDRFMERVSNDLHEYYTKKREVNYAARLLKLTRVVNSLQRLYNERKKVPDLAKLFDVIRPNICEPNFFG